jgi:nucleoid-associated protein YgaU
VGKEAKLGVAFILFLLVTFCAVLVWRLRGSSDEGAEAAAAAEEASPAAENPDEADRPDQAAHSVAKPANATLVEATSGEAPADSPLPVGQWNVATDEGAAARAASGDVEDPPSLSYMPIAPAPEPAKVHAPYGEQVPPMVEPAPTWQQGPAPLPDSVDRGAQPPGADQRYPMLPPPDSAQQDTGGLRLIEPPPARQDYAPVDRPLPAVPVGQSGRGFGPPPMAEGARTEDGKYTVQPNDSFWVISQRLYGTGAYFKALAEHNRDRFEAGDQLAVGDVISAPSREDLEEIYPGLCPKPAHREVLQNRLANVSSQRPYGGRTYLVQEGDTLFDIARYELGKASRWVEIYELNRHLIGSDHDYLPPGVELVLPNDAPTERMTQQPDPGSIYRR